MLPILSDKNQDRFEMIIENVTFDDKELAGKAIRTAAKKENRLGEFGEIGTYQGFTMFVSYNHISNSYNLKLQNQRSYLIELGENGLGNIIRINNALDNIPKHIARAKQNLQTYESQLEDAKIEVMKEFPKEADLKEKQIVCRNLMHFLIWINPIMRLLLKNRLKNKKQQK